MSSFYAVVPMWILESKELTPLEKLLCSVISGLSEKSGFCYAANEKLSLYLGISEEAARKALGRLISKNIVKNIGNKFDRKLVLSFIENSQDRNGQNHPFEDRNGQNVLSNGQNHPFASIIYQNNNISSSAEPNDIDFFDQFWEIYPRKSNKLTAKKKFERLSAKKQQQIIQLTYAFANDMRSLGRSEEHILLPTTYLNQERYLDYEQEQKAVQILPPKEGADLALERLVRKIKVLVEKYRKLDEDGRAALDARSYESFKTAEHNPFFEDSELEALKRAEARISDYADVEFQEGEIKRMMRGFVC